MMENSEFFVMSWVDYTIFILMLVLSASIGIYYGFKKHKNNTIEEYLFAGRNIPVVPVILSNMASNMSTIALVLLPVEVYYYGGQLIFVVLGEAMSTLILYFFYLPVFYELKYTSIFEYLEKRFNKPTRLLASAIYTITQIMYALIIMYSACVAIIKAIPLPFYILSSLVCLLCTTYTVMGGLRGVVWSDTVQALFMYLSIIAIIAITVSNAGGVTKVIDTANKGGRLDIFNFDPSLFSRYSSWAICLSAGFFSIYNNCVNTGIIQRYLSLPTYSKAKMVALWTGFANSAIAISSVMVGISVYSYYHDCDPLLSKELDNIDQLIPHHVIKLDNKPPGLAGLYFAGILSAALSSLSTMMNSLSGILFDDFVKPLVPLEWNNKQCSIWIKSIAVTLGFIITLGIFGLNPSAGTFQLYRTLTSLTGGLIIFVFAFGVFYRKANVKSVIIGAIAGVITSTWLGIGSQNAVESGKIKYITKIVSIEGCPANLSQVLNITTSGSGEYKSPMEFADDVPYPYRISFTFLIIVGVLVSCAVGLIVSLFTTEKKKLEESLLIPQIRKNNYESVCLKCEVKEIHKNYN
ncbi:sodium-coupled monocarboxylate transporter 1-like [Rhodnius prolixus]|uniref:sodium-coupled monocarboxylate transporter 1-like n=1 Tax=Rhodnius prolixus TaxID=13249 RepID=UPI003D1893A6